MKSSPPVRLRPLAVCTPDAPLASIARVLGDKPISHRALLVTRLAMGKTWLCGLDGRRVKQTDRLAATVVLHRADKTPAHVEDDTIATDNHVNDLGGGQVRTPRQHRPAMTAVVTGVAGRRPMTEDDMGFVDLMSRPGTGAAEPGA